MLSYYWILKTRAHNIVFSYLTYWTTLLRTDAWKEFEFLTFSCFENISFGNPFTSCSSLDLDSIWTYKMCFASWLGFTACNLVEIERKINDQRAFHDQLRWHCWRSIWYKPTQVSTWQMDAEFYYQGTIRSISWWSMVSMIISLEIMIELILHVVLSLHIDYHDTKYCIWALLIRISKLCLNLCGPTNYSSKTTQSTNKFETRDGFIDKRGFTMMDWQFKKLGSPNSCDSRCQKSPNQPKAAHN